VSVVILRGDAACLPMADESVDLICTSPPYWSQRDYRDGGESLRGQIGNEKTWQEYLANLLDCTREWVRVLKPGGSIFVVIGDKYSERSGPGHPNRGDETVGFRAERPRRKGPAETGIPAKSLIGLPWRYALACVDELGLINRRDNIWHKTSGMPESVDDRCATKHEYAFHLTREPRYFAAVDELREPHTMRPQRRPNGHKQRQQLGVLAAQTWSTSQRDVVGVDGHPLGRLPGSVWEIPTVPLNVPEWLEHARCCGGRKLPGCEDGLDHHAAFPPALARKCILGWSPSGICTQCGEGRRPVAERDPVGPRYLASNARQDSKSRLEVRGVSASSILRTGLQSGQSPATRITGYACACSQPDAPTRQAIVLDPFGGTGTTALVADMHGRTGVTVDRSADYCRIAQWRTADPAERARALGVPKPPPVPDGQGSLFDASEAS
jgi:DNA modification methylase